MTAFFVMQTLKLTTLFKNIDPMKIKNLKIDGKTFLAPLAGITNLPFRLLVKECGCAVVCSEMISAKGIFYNSKKTLDLCTSKKEESPLSIQIFGSDPDSMAKGAKVIEDLDVASIIDINFDGTVQANKRLKSHKSPRTLVWMPSSCIQELQVRDSGAKQIGT